jgi:hypothetical protein
MKSAKEIRDMLKVPNKNVYIKFAYCDLVCRIIGAVSVSDPVNKNIKKTFIKCLTHNHGKFFSICSTDMIYCQ